jgi:hypothetical protein
MPSTIGLYSGTSAPEVAGTDTTSLYGGSGVPVPGANGNTVIRGDLTVTGDATIQGELTVGDDVCIEGDTITLRCNATTIGNAQIIAYRGGGANTAATITWDETAPVPAGSEPNGRWVTNCGLTATGLIGGQVNIAPNLNDNLITTTTGTGVDLVLDADTNQITFAAQNLSLAQSTVFFYSEANNRLNRPAVQSSTGNTTGLRIQAPNATASAVAVSSVFNTNDPSNGKFINIRADGSATPISIRTGEFVAGVLGASGDSIQLIDGATTYATINPAGPSASTDLVTVAYLTGGTFVFNQVNIDNRVYLDSIQLITSTTAANQTLDSFAVATYRSAKYQISISSGADVHVMEVLVMQDGTTAFQTAYADMFSAASLTTINTTISGGNVLLRVTPTNAVTTYKVSRTLIVI